MANNATVDFAQFMIGLGTTAGINGSTSILPNTIISSAVAQSLVQSVAVTLTSAQILLLNTTPVVLVSGVTGKSTVIDYGMLRFNFGGTAYTGGGVSTIGYTSGAAVLNTLAAALFTAGASADTLLVTGASNITATQGANIQISTATNNFATGNGTATIFLWYTQQ